MTALNGMAPLDDINLSPPRTRVGSDFAASESTQAGFPYTKLYAQALAAVDGSSQAAEDERAEPRRASRVAEQVRPAASSEIWRGGVHGNVYSGPVGISDARKDSSRTVEALGQLAFSCAAPIAPSVHR
ncbi:hypothetical protein HPB50_006128 [Hyalomma asiaticum]|uniref:Uncharacterized protein n=1 Tax=Hyalomma asiaticum TaxID=266040 RepID=A0ACB7SLA3_HYAAI|nr:hypothetical protein HPB50_006128 [Hyalomma asiaticum]